MGRERSWELLWDYAAWLVENIGNIGDIELDEYLGIMRSTAERYIRHDRKTGSNKLYQYVANRVAEKIAELVETGMGIDPDWAIEECRTSYEGVLNEQGPEEADRWEEYGELSAKSAFLGTVFALAPSGKYYTPWANSNVNLQEAMHDAVYFDALDEAANAAGFYTASGEGDPCDVFLVAGDGWEWTVTKDANWLGVFKGWSVSYEVKVAKA